MKPARGLALVKPLDVERKIGSLYIPDKSVDRMVAQQVELVALGSPTLWDPDDVEGEGWLPLEYAGKHWVYREPDPRLRPGAWCIIQAWSQVPTEDENLFLVPQSAIVGVVE